MNAIAKRRFDLICRATSIKINQEYVIKHNIFDITEQPCNIVLSITTDKGVAKFSEKCFDESTVCLPNELVIWCTNRSSYLITPLFPKDFN